MIRSDFNSSGDYRWANLWSGRARDLMSEWMKARCRPGFVSLQCSVGLVCEATGTTFLTSLDTINERMARFPWLGTL